jgi:hypothetical protein
MMPTALPRNLNMNPLRAQREGKRNALKGKGAAPGRMGPSGDSCGPGR